QFLFPVAQAELLAEFRILESAALDLGKGAEKQADAAFQKAMLAAGQEARSQDGAQGAIAKGKMMLLLLLMQPLLRVGGEVVGQQIVINGNGIPENHDWLSWCMKTQAQCSEGNSNLPRWHAEGRGFVGWESYLPRVEPDLSDDAASR